MIEYENKVDSFEFEKYICLAKPELWKNEALNLFSSAQVLLEFSNLKVNDVFEKGNKLTGLFSEDISNKAFWNYRVIRMLWGYGFENILKGIIVKNFKSADPTLTNTPIEKIKTHNLLPLFNKANIRLIEEQVFYLQIIEKCSVWMGRYPLPIKPDQMYDQRKSMSTREELFERSRELHEKWVKGEIPRIISESDVLHGGIGQTEYDIIKNLIEVTKGKFEE